MGGRYWGAIILHKTEIAVIEAQDVQAIEDLKRTGMIRQSIAQNRSRAELKKQMRAALKVIKQNRGEEFTSKYLLMARACSACLLRPPRIAEC